MESKSNRTGWIIYSVDTEVYAKTVYKPKNVRMKNDLSNENVLMRFTVEL